MSAIGGLFMFNTFKQKTPKKLYPKILFSFTVSISFTIVLLSTVLYMSFQTIVLQLTNSYVKDNLTQVSYSANLMNKTAYSLLMQLNVDNDMRSVMLD